MKIHLIEPLNVEQTIIDKYIPELRKYGYEFKQWKDRKEDAESIIERCKDAEVVIVSNIPFTTEIIDACPNLKMLSVAFTGVDHIDMKTCRKRGIIVSNAAGYSTQSVAELTIGLMISLLRKIPYNEHKLRTLHGRDGFTGSELFGKTIGIIGAGAIGQAVGKICKLAFGCEILYYSRTKKQVDEGRFVSKKELLEQSDIVSLHVPLNSETKGMVGEEELALMKSTALLINTARGPVLDTHALVQALKKDSIGGAAIDMYEMEPPLPKDHEILSAPNTILMPHIAYATKEAFVLRTKIVFENILKWHAGEPQNVQ